MVRGIKRLDPRAVQDAVNPIGFVGHDCAARPKTDESREANGFLASVQRTVGRAPGRPRECGDWRLVARVGVAGDMAGYVGAGGYTIG